jgi:hypothetical protein
MLARIDFGCCGLDADTKVVSNYPRGLDADRLLISDCGCGCGSDIQRSGFAAA